MREFTLDEANNFCLFCLISNKHLDIKAIKIPKRIHGTILPQIACE